MDTATKRFKGDTVKRVVFALLESLQWFEAEPYPDGTWEITIRTINERFLEVLAERYETEEGD